VPHAAPDVFTSAVLGVTVVGFLAWRLSLFPALLCGGLAGILARSRLFGLLRLLT
jgi:hypothetical protein